MNGYICTFRHPTTPHKNQRCEIYTDKGTYQAQCDAAKQMGIKPSWQHRIDVYLAEKDGQAVVHTPDF